MQPQAFELAAKPPDSGFVRYGGIRIRATMRRLRRITAHISSDSKERLGKIIVRCKVRI
jgi:hypothetical protein